MNLVHPFVAFVACIATGCVSKVKYDATERALAEQSRFGSEADQNRRTTEAQLDACRREIASLTAAFRTSEQSLSERKMATHNLQARLDESTAIDERLRDELQRLGKNVDQLLTDRGAMSHALEDAKTRLEELRKAQAAEETKAALYNQLALQFKKLTDAGQLEVLVRDGRMVLELPAEVLFDPGHAMLQPSGQRTLDRVSAVLKALDGRRFQVAARADDMVIDSKRSASNWELSTTRAISVVRYLTARGVSAATLSVAVYGELGNVDTNEAVDRRAKNRVIDVTLTAATDGRVTVSSAK